MPLDPWDRPYAYRAVAFRGGSVAADNAAKPAPADNAAKAPAADNAAKTPAKAPAKPAEKK